MQETQPETAVDLYLRLLKRSLTDTVRPDRPDYVPLDPQGRLKGPLYRQFMRYLRTRGIDAVYREERWDVRKREEGRDWPLHADTMIGLRRLDNVEECVRTVL